MSYSNEQIIFDFKTQSDVEKWYQTNDDVMGGISNSKMTLDEKVMVFFLEPYLQKIMADLQ